jgi:50S ribosomal subunit-associated GTPase HflX
MSDTVGFVRHLPHQLVEAFRSTLEEVADADLILHVVDGSHPDPEGQLAAVREVFAEIDATGVPELVVINKADIADPMVIARLLAREPHSVVVSAQTGEGRCARRSRSRRRTGQRTRLHQHAEAGRHRRHRRHLLHRHRHLHPVRPRRQRGLRPGGLPRRLERVELLPLRWGHP